MTVRRTDRPTKIPGIPKPPNSAGPELRRYLESLSEAMEIRLGRRGDPVDRAVTLRELIQSGLARELRASPFDPNNIGGGNIGFVDDGQVDVTNTPPQPTGFAVTPAYSVNNLIWDFPLYTGPNHSQTEIYAYPTDSLGDAIAAGVRGVASGRAYTDPVGEGVTTYYWIRHVNEAGTPGPWSSASGVEAITAMNVTQLLAHLERSIPAVALVQGLEPISVVDSLPTVSGYSGPNVILLSTDGKIYRLVSGAWTAAVPTVDLSGTISELQIANDAVTNAKIAVDAIQGDVIAAGAIDGSKIAADAITATKLADDAVTNAKIAVDAIQGDVIAAGAIDGSKIAADAITATKLADDAVTNAKIAVDAIQSDVIAAGAITETKITNDAITSAKISANAITAAKINAGAITATKIATNAITSDKISAGAITANEIAANAITSAKISAGAIDAGKIAANAITSAKISAGAITATEIATNAITSDKVLAGAITASEIATNAITAAKISAGAIEAGKIAANAITAANISAGAVTATEIATNAITSVKISAGAVTAAEIATGAITALKISADAITADKIAANAVTADSLAVGAVTAGVIAAGAINSSTIISDGVIVGNKIAANTISAANIQAGTIGAAEISAGAITATEISAGAVDASKLVIDGSSITSVVVNGTPTLQLGSVNVNKLTGNSISATIMSGTTVYADKLTGDVSKLLPFRSTAQIPFLGNAASGGGTKILTTQQLPASTHPTGHKAFASVTGWYDSTANKTYSFRLYMQDTAGGSQSLGTPSGIYLGYGARVVLFSGDKTSLVQAGQTITATGKSHPVTSATYNSGSNITSISYGTGSGGTFTTSDSVTVSASSGYVLVGETRFKANTNLYAQFALSGSLTSHSTGLVNMKLEVTRTGASGIYDNDTSTATDVVSEVSGFMLGAR
jgi:hypothetical protein